MKPVAESLGEVTALVRLLFELTVQSTVSFVFCPTISTDSTVSCGLVIIFPFPVYLDL